MKITVDGKQYTLSLFGKKEIEEEVHVTLEKLRPLKKDNLKIRAMFLGANTFLSTCGDLILEFLYPDKSTRPRLTREVKDSLQWYIVHILAGMVQQAESHEYELFSEPNPNDASRAEIVGATTVTAQGARVSIGITGGSAKTDSAARDTESLVSSR